MAVFAARVHCWSWSAWCPPGPAGPSLQSCFPVSWPPACTGAWDCSCLSSSAKFLLAQFSRSLLCSWRRGSPRCCPGWCFALACMWVVEGSGPSWGRRAGAVRAALLLAGKRFLHPLYLYQFQFLSYPLLNSVAHPSWLRLSFYRFLTGKKAKGRAQTL